MEYVTCLLRWLRIVNKIIGVAWCNVLESVDVSVVALVHYDTYV